MAAPIRIRVPQAAKLTATCRAIVSHTSIKTARHHMRRAGQWLFRLGLGLLQHQVRPIQSRDEAKQISARALKIVGFYVTMSLAALVSVMAASAILFGSDAGAPVTAPIGTSVPDKTGSVAPATDPWVRLSKPLTLYSVDAAEFSKLPQQHQARRHSIGNGREDRYTVGDFSAPQLFFDVRLYRPGGESQPQQTLFVETVRRLAPDGLMIARMAMDEQHRTKFGMASVADTAVQYGDRQRNCLAFRLGGASDALNISGLACGAEAKQIDRATLTCFIDRIDLVASGDDVALRKIFSAAELSRHEGCTKSRLTSVGRKATWLDVDGTAPAFKPALEVAEKPSRPKKKKTAARRE